MRRSKVRLTAMLFLAVGACAPGHVFRIEKTKDGVFTNFSTLGDYPTTFTSIEIRSVDSGAVVWLIRGKDTPQAHGVALLPGANPSVPPLMNGSGTVDVMVPRGSETFVLESGRDYRIEVCFPGRGNGWCEGEQFRL